MSTTTGSGVGTSEESYEKPELKVKFKIIPETQLKSFTDLFQGYNEGLVKSEPGGTVLPTVYSRDNNAQEVYQFEPRKDDVWVVTFPKCGTTWTQELVWLLMNNCNTEVKTQLFAERSPMVELMYVIPANTPEETRKAIPTPRMIAERPAPVVVKSHLPFYLLHPKLLETSKVVYVARNPKDVIVSYYFHHKLFKLHNYTGDLETFVKYFINDEVMFSPFFGHILDAWNKRHHPNLLFIFYEDMKKDLRGEIEKMAKFLDKSLTEEQLDRMTHHLRVDTFSKNEMANFEVGKTSGLFNLDAGNFVRKGKTGDWMNYFSPEMNKRVDEWIAQHLAESDLKFLTELDQQD